MNIDRMHLEFKLSLDKLDSSAYPDLQPAEIDYWLNTGYLRAIKTRYSRNNIYRQGFEEIQKRTDDLKALVVTNYAAVSAVTTETATYKIDLATLFTNEAHSVANTTEKYMFYLRGRARHVVASCGSQYCGVNIVRHDDLDSVLYDPFKKPYVLESVAYFERGSLYVVTDGSYTIDKFKVTYLKKPLLIDKAQILSPLGLTGSQTIEIDDHMQDEVIQEAVKAALENIESPRQTTFENPFNKVE
jgi:hypothetical protein